MIKELVKMANRLDAMGLKVEADGIDNLIRKIAGEHRDESEDPGDWSDSGNNELKTSTVGTIWLAQRSAYGGYGDPSVIHYFARKVDADAWFAAQKGYLINNPPYIQEVEVEVANNLK